MFPEVILFSPAFYLFERNWSLTLFVSLSRYHTYYLTGLVLIYNQLGLTCYAYVRYRLFCFVFVTSNEVQNIFTVDALKMGVWRAFMKEEFKWRTMKTGNVKGNQRLKHWANDYPRFWPKRGCWPSKQKQCDWKKPVTEKPFAWRSQEWIKCDIQQTKPGLLRTEAGGRQSWDRSLDGLTVNWQPIL